jgi:hypothetical protein
LENISEFFYEKLKNTTTPGVVLTQFYSALFDVEGGRSEIIKLNKLIKVFGRFSVFFSVMSMGAKAITGVNEEFPYGLIYKICKDNLEKKNSDEIAAVSSKDLSKDIDALQKEIESTVTVYLDKETEELLNG